MLLYHGSKSGIKGHIEPKSRDACDFGQGFYMGDLPDQPKGLIADDKMTQALQRFFMGELCDAALIEAMQKVSLGKQYVLKTKEACDESHVRILQQRLLTTQELKMARAISDNRNRELDQMSGQLKSRYRRAQDVKFFDEIIEEWNGQ